MCRVGIRKVMPDVGQLTAAEYEAQVEGLAFFRELCRTVGRVEPAAIE
jgi:hypothetical protein